MCDTYFRSLIIQTHLQNQMPWSRGLHPLSYHCNELLNIALISSVHHYSNFSPFLCSPFLISISCFSLQKFQYLVWNAGIHNTFNEHYTNKSMHNTKTLHKILTATSPVLHSTILREKSTLALNIREDSFASCHWLPHGYITSMLGFPVDLSKYQVLSRFQTLNLLLYFTSNLSHVRPFCPSLEITSECNPRMPILSGQDSPCALYFFFPGASQSVPEWLHSSISPLQRVVLNLRPCSLIGS